MRANTMLKKPIYSPECNNTQPCDPPNTYPLARRVLGRYAPGTRRAIGPVPVIADVR